MSIITEYYKEAELALAAYANLTPDIVDDLYIDALIGIKMGTGCFLMMDLS